VQNKIQKRIEDAAVAAVDPLKELEPMAAAVETNEVAPQPSTFSPAKPRGLSWYMKARGATLAPPTAPAAPPKAELLSYAQTPSSSTTQKETPSETPAAPATPDSSGSFRTASERKTESELFAYMAGEPSSKSEPAVAESRPWLRRSIFAGALLALCIVAYITVPQARWHQNLQLMASSAVHFAHNWLNPQATTPVQVPRTHENFGLAGDEYKLPVAQNIPDATTDPTQIRVVPIVDPTAKQPNGAANASQTPVDTSPIENSAPNSGDEQQSPVQVQETPQTGPVSPGAGDASPSPAPPLPKVVEPSPAEMSTPNVAPARRDPMQPVSRANSRPQPATVATFSKPTAGIPSSLKSQMASMTPDASGNKPAEASLPSIEPVDLPEATARGLLLQQSDPAYPDTAKGQRGTVVLQVLIARDGSVQDAKFLQGSLAFARAATDAVKQWRFKPYTLNGRPVSTRTVLTLAFKPTS
jgi:periplasmic protein TonB